MKTKHIHVSNTFILFVGLTVATIAFFYFQGNHTAQKLIALICGALYACWGIVHHAMMKNLYPKVVLEYLLVSIIGVVLMVMVLG